MKAIPRVTFDINKSYVIVGGTTDFGLELANWMIKRGAKKIILNSKRGITNGFQTLCLNKWTTFKDIKVEINTSDVFSKAGAQCLITTALQLGFVGGKVRQCGKL